MSKRDSIGEFLLVLDSANGREKLARLIQYAAKYFKWKEEIEKQRNERLVQVWGNVQTSMSNVRKFLRLFRTLAVLRSFRQSFPSSVSDLTAPLFFNLTGKLFLASYFLFDHAIYANNLGLWTPDTETLRQTQLMTEGSWLGEVSTILEQLATLASLHSSAQQSSLSSVTTATTDHSVTTLIINPAPPSAIRAASLAAIRTLIRSLLDLPIALQGLDAEVVRGIPHGHFGLMGTASSLLALYEMWPVLLVKE